jgi:cytochrome c biogenesis protein CcmG, thiol:disulfide interchange protein DsbE
VNAGIKRRIVVISVVGLFAALFVFGILRDPTRRDDLPSALLDKRTPDFSIPLFDRYRPEYGATLDTAELKGKPLIVNFWASWCLPCREEMPVLEASWQEYRNDVLFVGVNTQETNEADARALMNEFNLSYPNGVDESNRINIDYGLFGLPETFFIRADGTLQYRHSGPVTLDVMDEQIRLLLGSS